MTVVDQGREVTTIIQTEVAACTGVVTVEVLRTGLKTDIFPKSKW